MDIYIAEKEDEGKRLDRFVAEKRPELSRVFILKALRLKKIRRNGKRAEGGDRLLAGDEVLVRLAEGTGAARTDGFFVAYEDERILVAEKRAGLLSGDAAGRAADTLEKEVNAYLAPKGERARLCHRIDFNTEGLVVLAKDGEAFLAMTEAIRRRQVEKRYLCAAVGRVRPAAGTLSGYLFKDAKKRRVYVTDAPAKGAKTAVTKYRTLAERGGLSLVECELVTGRTHQIRSQMAHAGWPLLGDEKYGSKSASHPWGERRQLLAAWRVTFRFPPETPVIGYLSGRTVTMRRVAFREKYFGKQKK